MTKPIERPNVDEIGKHNKSINSETIDELIAWIKHVEEEMSFRNRDNIQYEAAAQTTLADLEEKNNDLTERLEMREAEAGYHEAKDVIEQLTAQRDQFKELYEKLLKETSNG